MHQVCQRIIRAAKRRRVCRRRSARHFICRVRGARIPLSLFARCFSVALSRFDIGILQLPCCFGARPNHSSEPRTVGQYFSCVRSAVVHTVQLQPLKHLPALFRPACEYASQ